MNKISKILLILLGFILSLLLFKSFSPPQINRPKPLAQEPLIQVYFNQNQSQKADYTEPYRQITRMGDNLEQILIDEINLAKSTIDVAVQELRLPNLAKALAKRKREGLQVRLILENTYNRPFSDFKESEIQELDERNSNRYQEFIALVDRNEDGKLSSEEINEGDALVIVKNADIPLIDDTEDGSKGAGLMHHKFMIIDGVRLIVTSANFTTSDVHGDFANPDTRGNTNNLLKINNPELARLFTEEFNLLWGDGSGGKKDSLFGVHKPVRQPRTVNLGKTTVTVHFSPTPATLDWSESSNGLIGKTLENANKSADLALFVFSEQKLANILEERHQKGVEVRTLIDPEFAFRSYSEGLDMLGVTLTNKCRIEKDNNPWKSPIKTVGISQLPQGDKLHHKFGLIDGETVITGSHNWSASANYTNDETLLVINSPIVAAHFNREFERLYSNAVLGLTEKVSNKIQEDSERCPQITRKSPSDSRSKLVNINTATQEELETLPGIGAKLAQRIIEARQEKPFTSLDDLERVRGIKKSKLKKLEGNVSW